jgi:PHD/YefM family antitoxin component YafN of YafNO toxin-antitoxin module
MLKSQFIKDSKGNKIAVLLPIEKYKEMLELLEDIEDIKAFRDIKESDDEIISFDKA